MLQLHWLFCQLEDQQVAPPHIINNQAPYILLCTHKDGIKSIIIFNRFQTHLNHYHKIDFECTLSLLLILRPVPGLLGTKGQPENSDGSAL